MIRIALLACIACAACGNRSAPEATSLLGKPLVSPPLAPEERTRREQDLASARADLAANPRSADAAIWVGRRLGYLGRFREALAAYTKALEQHPNDARLYRHRGHRFITLRRFDRAIADFERAAQLRAGKPDEIEPDGMPNASNTPTSTLHGNIYYHLALAHYLMRDFAAAERDFRTCLDTATNDDSRVSAGYWLYLAQRRQGKDREAALLARQLPPKPALLENHAYHELLRLFRGDLGPDELARTTDLDRVTIGYGVAIWRLLRGDTEAARADLRAIVDGGNWPAFGAIAAEAELAAR